MLNRNRKMGKGLWVGLALTGIAAAGTGLVVWHRRNNTPTRRFLRRAKKEAGRAALASRHFLAEAKDYAEKAKEPLERGRDALVRAAGRSRSRIPALMSAGVAALGSGLAAVGLRRIS
jgi:hypothetical protein